MALEYCTQCTLEDARLALQAGLSGRWRIEDATIAAVDAYGKIVGLFWADYEGKENLDFISAQNEARWIKWRLLALMERRAGADPLHTCRAGENWTKSGAT